MTKLKFYCTALILTCGLFAFTKGPKTGEDVLKMMHNRYAGKWHNALAFQQVTEIYRNDSLVRRQTWQEAMLAPDKLRIDVEPIINGITIIFRNDSTYRFRNGKLAASINQENDLIFLLGGMYHYPWKQSVERVKKAGYDLSKCYEDTWKGRPVYVIGTAAKDDKPNQIWVDKEHLYIVRFIKQAGKSREEGIFGDHIKLGNGWSETKVDFYLNGKLAQVEKYSNVREPANIDPTYFDPGTYARYQEIK